MLMNETLNCIISIIGGRKMSIVRKSTREIREVNKLCVYEDYTSVVTHFDHQRIASLSNGQGTFICINFFAGRYTI